MNFPEENYVATTPTPVQNRFLLNHIRNQMGKLNPNAHLIQPTAPRETLAQKIKRMRCERLGRHLALLRGLKLRFYNRYCLVVDPTNLPPKDYDYS